MQTLILPDYARLPDVRRMSWYSIELMDRVWQRAQTLFCPDDDPSQPDTGYRILPYAGQRGPTKNLYIIFKPRPLEGYPDYTESRYVYDAEEQTCSCPFFSGIEPTHWSDTFEVKREWSRIVTYDRDGIEVKPDHNPHGYCKHQFAALLYFATRPSLSGIIGVDSPNRRSAVDVGT